MSDPIVPPPLSGTEHGLAVDPTKVVSPKTIAAAVASFLVPAVLATLTYVLSNPDTLPIHNPVLGVLVFAVITSLITTLSAFLKTDPLRNG